MTLQGRGDSVEKLHRKDEELALATDVVVPSKFVLNTLRKAGRLEASEHCSLRRSWGAQSEQEERRQMANLRPYSWGVSASAKA